MLSPDDLALVEGTVLPALERHYLRLLAHGLRTFQAIASTTPTPSTRGTPAAPDPSPWLPDRGAIETWAASQAAMADDPGFQEAFLEQLLRLHDPLQAIASPLGLSPLDLRIEHLVTWATTQADARLNRSVASPLPEGSAQPPG
jgi:hypothetical protein